MTLIPDEASESAERRVALTTGLRDLAIYLDTHPGSPLPSVRAVFPVPSGPRAAQVDAVQDVADWLGVPMEGEHGGMLVAARRFGPLTAEARLEAEDADADRPLPEIPGLGDIYDAADGWHFSAVQGGAR